MLAEAVIDKKNTEYLANGGRSNSTASAATEVSAMFAPSADPQRIAETGGLCRELAIQLVPIIS